MRADKNFRMSKRTKTIMSLLPMTSSQRHDFRESMIQAELAAEEARKASLRSKGSKQDKE